MTDKIFPIPALKDNYIWAIVDGVRKTAVVVDPGDAEPVFKFLREHDLVLAGILVTHHHFDHTNGIAGLSKHYKIKVYGAAKDIATNCVTDKDCVEIKDFPLKFTVLAIPGHTLDHVAFYANKNIFCGDTLFAAGCGKIFEGDAEQMLNSLQKLTALPRAAKIYCGHEYTLKNLQFASLVEPNNKDVALRLQKIEKLRAKNLPSLPALMSEEIATNPFLRCDSKDVISNVEKYAQKKLANIVDVFYELRRWKDAYS